ncbi:MAG: acyl-CoA dehydrogenase, partial [Streptosporangiaceae bacterium]|nr:acyl-CoA dehydrogenase [Streptosporangiaceae bacterium]
MTDLAHDYLDLDSLLTADEQALRGRVRAFVDERIRPNIARWYEA